VVPVVVEVFDVVLDVSDVLLAVVLEVSVVDDIVVLDVSDVVLAVVVEVSDFVTPSPKRSFPC
jgi:hypothetical protein